MQTLRKKNKFTRLCSVLMVMMCLLGFNNMEIKANVTYDESDLSDPNVLVTLQPNDTLKFKNEVKIDFFDYDGTIYASEKGKEFTVPEYNKVVNSFRGYSVTFIGKDVDKGITVLQATANIAPTIKLDNNEVIPYGNPIQLSVDLIELPEGNYTYRWVNRLGDTLAENTGTTQLLLTKDNPAYKNDMVIGFVATNENDKRIICKEVTLKIGEKPADVIGNTPPNIAGDDQKVNPPIIKQNGGVATADTSHFAMMGLLFIVSSCVLIVYNKKRKA